MGIVGLLLVGTMPTHRQGVKHALFDYSLPDVRPDRARRDQPIILSVCTP